MPDLPLPRPPVRFATTMLRAIFVAFVLAALGWSLLEVATREVDEVRVHGDLSEAERNEVGAAASSAIVAGRRSAAAIVAAVEALGWSHDVRAWRRWPDRMHVAVTREPLAARWGDDAYLTTSGEIVALPDDLAQDSVETSVPAENSAAPARTHNMPTLRTTQANGIQAMRLYGLLAGAAGAADLAIVELAENALGEWTVTLDNGVSVVLGASEVSSRFDRFLVVWARELANHDRAAQRVDTRYPAGVAVAWAETVVPAEAPAQVASVAKPSPGAEPNASALPTDGLVAVEEVAARAASSNAMPRAGDAKAPARQQPDTPAGHARRGDAPSQEETKGPTMRRAITAANTTASPPPSSPRNQ